MSVQAVHLHFDVYTSAGYMLRIDCWEAEKNLKTTPGSECALTSLAIDANNLVGSLSTQCCFIQSIIFSSRPEIFKALLDCYIFHRGNPKPLKRLSAPGFVVHQSKDQLSLTTGICCTHNTCNIFSGHELFQNPKLFSRTGRNLILPVHRENRQVCISPFAVLRIIGFRLCQLHQMPHTPADHISVSL